MGVHGGDAAAYVGRADALRFEKFSKRRQGIQILPHLTRAELDLPNLLGLEPEHGVNQCLHPCRTQAERGHATGNPVLYGAARILDLGYGFGLWGLYNSQNPLPPAEVVPRFPGLPPYVVDLQQHDQGLLDRRYLRALRQRYGESLGTAVHIDHEVLLV